MTAQILILEDVWLIAEDLQTIILALGHKVLGPASTCAKALELIIGYRPDLALLDTQIGRETSQAVVAECERLGVPIVITTGHVGRDLPEFCQYLPILGKPFSAADVERVVAEHLPVLQTNLPPELASLDSA